MSALYAIKHTSRDGDSSCVGAPRRKWATHLLFPFSYEFGMPVKRIVSFDDEMRSWGRYDWVRQPTADDLARAAADAHLVIPAVPAGGSVQIEVTLESSAPDGSSSAEEAGAK